MRGRPKKKKEVIGNDEVLIPSDGTPSTISKEQQEKKDKLNSILRELNKGKKGIINYASTLENRERQSFGYKCLDKLTGGGILRGSFTTLYGHKGCGKSTIAYKLIATAQKENKICAYLDVERSYDPEWAKKFGVDTEKLVYIACPIAEEVLDILIKLCREKVVDFICLDSIQGLSPSGEQYEGKAKKEKSVEADTMALLARKLSQFFRMAMPYVAEAKCAVLLIGQVRTDLGSFIKMDTLSGGHALLHNSRLILKIRRGQKADALTEKVEKIVLDEEGDEVKKKVNKIVGFDCVISVEKSQVKDCIENEEVHIPFHFIKGIQE
jgi:recombination protein RecA